MNPYEVLGVTQDATPKQIIQARRRQKSKHHPDRASLEPGAQEAAHAKMLEIDEAFTILMDEDRRTNFDRTGSTKRHTSDEDEARRLVASLVLEWAGRGVANLARCVISQVEMLIREVPRVRMERTLLLEKFAAQVDSVHARGKENFFRLVLEAHVQQLARELSDVDRDEHRLNLALQIAQRHSDSPPATFELPAPAQQLT